MPAKRRAKSCIDCPDHQVIGDRDPDDWFCDDDVAVICKLTKTDKCDPKSRHPADRSKFKRITCACRPYNTRKETTPIPKWCPKKNEIQ